MSGAVKVLESMDRCTKCGICQAHCPVATATEAFPGPKYTGPQGQRFRVIEQFTETSPMLCSGCGICTSVCPNDVKISDIIAFAKAAMLADGAKLPLGQKVMNRPEGVGRIAAVAPTLANGLLGNRALRGLAEAFLGLHRDAPLPRFHGGRFRRWLARHQQPDGPVVSYFTGCAIEHYDPFVGIAAVRVLNSLGLRVSAPTKACCALPMLSSGEWGAARGRAEALVASLAGAERPIVSTSTSCSLTLREKYATYLSMTEGAAAEVADAIVDICEFLLAAHSDALEASLTALPLRVLYHGPCQLRGHAMGQPALELLRLIPELALEVSEASCCGIAGTYGYDKDKHAIAMAVGDTLFKQINRGSPDVVVTDSETCRWHTEQATQVPCRHPVELLAASIDGNFEAWRSERS